MAMDALSEFAHMESPFVDSEHFEHEQFGAFDADEAGEAAGFEGEQWYEAEWDLEQSDLEHEHGTACSHCGEAHESEMSELFQAENDHIDGADQFFESSGNDFELELEQEGPSDPLALAVRAAIFLGTRSESKLTNMVFFMRHPERGGKKLDNSEPNFKALSAEWLSIRNNIVRPLLRTTKASGKGTSSSTGKTGPLPAVSARMPASGLGYNTRQTSKNRFYGTPETVEALKWIGAQWAAKNSDLTFWIHDISQQGGGKISGHRSHRIGWDADIQLRHNNVAVDMRKPGYAKYRSSVQALVDIIESNPVLPMKAIGFMDRGVTGPSLRRWKGHVRHLHLRFCMPASHRADFNYNKVRVPGEKKTNPNYRCKPAKGESESGEYGQESPLDEAESEFEGAYYDQEDMEAGYHSPFGEMESFEFDSESEHDEYEADYGYGEHDDDLFDSEYFHDDGESENDASPGFAPEFEHEGEGESPLAELAVKLAIRFGNRSEVSLTNMVFAGRHPSRGGRPIDPGEPDFATLSAEWVDIRNRIVRPLLAAGATGVGGASPSGGSKFYGGKWGHTRPPGLPTWVRAAETRGSALADVGRVAGGQGLGRHFVLVCQQMAVTESGATYGLPAITFNAKPKAQRGGKKLITAWGVFQYNRDAWTSRIPKSARSVKRSFVAKGVPGCSEEPGCVFPWDVTKAEEIGIPIAHFAATYREILASGGSSRDAAGGVRIRHKSPVAYRKFQERGRDHGFLSAWSNLSGTMRRSVEGFLAEAAAR